ncbi:MAG: 2-oxoacid:acceptor oxidoreductase subunit alpha [Euryarchaeota archaeon]|nr:2-oxoacid:acceptor oxidoreductase subunit alpha [Euryarchaeota archaeon]
MVTTPAAAAAPHVQPPIPTERVGPPTRPTEPLHDVSIMIGGQGGDGTLTVSDLLGRYFHATGLYIYTARAVLSRIRGGHADASTRAHVEPIWSQKPLQDVLVAFDDDAVKVGQKELAPHGVVLADQGSVKTEGPNIYHLPLSITAASKVGNGLYKNTVAYGALSVLLGFDRAAARGVIEKRFARRGGDALQANLKAFDLGCELVKEAGLPAPLFTVASGHAKGQVLISGNVACALGFVVAGGRFFAGYPITPATPIMENLDKILPQFDGIVRQAEDELGAINMAIGAAYTGARTMTATSGPGLSLMTEGMGHAGEAEVPLVIVDCQRVGPSTGEPTRHEQSDLLFVVFASHGEFPRFVLAPGYASDVFETTVAAVNLAEKWQIPVFIMLDNDESENTQSTPAFDLSKVHIDRGKLLRQEELDKMAVYKRYELTPDGISPRSVPGMKGGISQTTGNEHDEFGHVSVNPENRRKMMAKRMNRLELAKNDLPSPHLWGDEHAKVGFIGYGSTYGPIREAQEILKTKGIVTRFFQARTLWPVPKEALTSFLNSVDVAFVVEHNYTGQFARLIRQELPALAPKLRSMAKYDGLAFRAPEIVRPVEEEHHARGR